MIYSALFALALLFAYPDKNTATAWTAGWSHDDKYVAVGNDQGELAIYETTHWKKVRSWKYKQTTITRLEWNPKQPILAIAGLSHSAEDTLVQLFDLTKMETMTTLPRSLFGRALSWSPDGEKIAYVGNQGSISIFSKKGDHLKTLSFRNPRSLMDIDWHPHKNILVAVEEDIFLIDIDKDSLLATYDDGWKSKGILSTQWHPDGQFFVTGDYGHESEGKPSYIQYWALDGRRISQVKEGKAEYRNIRWSADGRYLAAATDGLLVLDKKANVIKKHKLGTENIWGVAWNKKGDRIISSDQGGYVRITDMEGKILHAFQQ